MRRCWASCLNCPKFARSNRPATRLAIRPALRCGALNPSANGALFRQCNNYALECLQLDDPRRLAGRVVPGVQPDADHPQSHPAEQSRLLVQARTAKRRLLFALSALGLNTDSRRSNPETGLQFEFLEDGNMGAKVLTGHDNGLITMNIAEADDALREGMRAEMHEPYRPCSGISGMR